jgi:hypothetical protein
MNSKPEPVVLDGHNYGIWAQGIETLLKSKALWQFSKITVPNPKDDHHKFVINKKDETVGVVMTDISKEICFHTRKIDCSNVVWKKLKTSFVKTNDDAGASQIPKTSVEPTHVFLNT